MTVKYVVSIAGEILYFDENRNPSAAFQPIVGDRSDKPALVQVPLREHIATAKEWDTALGGFSGAQRAAAQIGVVENEAEPPG